MRLASRLELVKPSITLAVTARAAQLKAKGIDVISFGAGEPDFDTPDHIKDAAKRALDKGQTKYTNVAGTPELRAAIVAEMKKAHGLDFTPEQVIVSAGAKHSLYNLFQALLDPGDEVVIPAPYWVSYPDLVVLAGGKPVIVDAPASANFQITPEQLDRAITPRTRALILCSPSNPTGAVYDKKALEGLAEVVVKRDILVVSDDIYRRLAYGDTKVVEIATLGPELAKRTIIIDGFSKTYAMTGWRLGYTVGPVPLISAMGTIQGQSTSNPVSIAQAGAIAALTGPDEPVEKMRVEFEKRRDVMVEKLNAMPGVRCNLPGGAFYAFPDVSAAFVGKKTPDGKTLASDIELSEWLLNSHKVAVVPGSGFGAPGFVRLSYATSLSAITIGLARIAEGLRELTW